MARLAPPPHGQAIEHEEIDGLELELAVANRQLCGDDAQRPRRRQSGEDLRTLRHAVSVGRLQDALLLAKMQGHGSQATTAGKRQTGTRRGDLARRLHATTPSATGAHGAVSDASPSPRTVSPSRYEVVGVICWPQRGRERNGKPGRSQRRDHGDDVGRELLLEQSHLIPAALRPS